MLISFLLAFIYDTCIGLVYGQHKVTFQEKNWFEEIHRKNKECDTESIDDYIKVEILKIFAQLRNKYPSLAMQYLSTSNNDSDSDEFIIAFMGKKKTDAEFQKEKKSTAAELGAELVASCFFVCVMTERTHSYYCICERFYIIHRKQTN
jgi:hypothetical protein